MTKELCECGKIAVWLYMPGYSSDSHPFHCEDCVPRGCECTLIYCKDYEDYPIGKEDVDFRWIEKDVCWVDLDEKQREHPCAEYGFEPDGFERDINPHLLN